MSIAIVPLGNKVALAKRGRLVVIGDTEDDARARYAAWCEVFWTVDYIGSSRAPLPEHSLRELYKKYRANLVRYPVLLRTASRYRAMGRTAHIVAREVATLHQINLDALERAMLIRREVVFNAARLIRDNLVPRSLPTIPDFIILPATDADFEYNQSALDRFDVLYDYYSDMLAVHRLISQMVQGEGREHVHSG